MPPRSRIDSTLVKAIARAYSWPWMIESGRYGSVTELAAAEQINLSYVHMQDAAADAGRARSGGGHPGRADGIQPPKVDTLLKGFPVEWAARRKTTFATLTRGH